MPITVDGQPVISGFANTIMAMAMRPRIKKSAYSRVGQFTRSTRLVETYPFYGAVPPLRTYQNGRLKMSKRPSFSVTIPNILMKSGIWIDRSEGEMDQTRTILNSAADFGVRIVEAPDMLLAKRLLTGSTAGSQNITIPGAQIGYSGQYSMTMDNQPIFSANHTDWFSGGAKSNIIQSNLPTTTSAFNALTPTQVATALQQDMQAFVGAVSNVKDTAGVQLWPNLDPEVSVIIFGPQILKPGLTLTFSRSSNGQSTMVNLTTNVFPSFVKEVITSGFLSSVLDVESETDTMLTPTNPLDYYAMIVDDYVKPIYIQAYAPPTSDDTYPRGYDVNEEIDRTVEFLGDDSAANVQAATFYSSAIIDMNIGRQGSNADAEVALRDRFFVVPRMRYNVGYGIWPLLWKFSASGT